MAVKEKAYRSSKKSYNEAKKRPAPTVLHTGLKRTCLEGTLLPQKKKEPSVAELARSLLSVVKKEPVEEIIIDDDEATPAPANLGALLQHSRKKTERIAKKQQQEQFSYLFPRLTAFLARLYPYAQRRNIIHVKVPAKHLQTQLQLLDLNRDGEECWENTGSEPVGNVCF